MLVSAFNHLRLSVTKLSTTPVRSSPKRVKYREELNQERRKRGMCYDGSHRDISHTQGIKLTIEDSMTIVHFKDKGTLRPVQKS